MITPTRPMLEELDVRDVPAALATPTPVDPTPTTAGTPAAAAPPATSATASGATTPSLIASVAVLPTFAEVQPVAPTTLQNAAVLTTLPATLPSQTFLPGQALIGPAPVQEIQNGRTLPRNPIPGRLADQSLRFPASGGTAILEQQAEQQQPNGGNPRGVALADYARDIEVIEEAVLA